MRLDVALLAGGAGRGNGDAERREDPTEVLKVASGLFDDAVNVQVLPGVRALVLAVHGYPAVEADLLEDAEHVRPRDGAARQRRDAGDPPVLAERLLGLLFPNEVF